MQSRTEELIAKLEACNIQECRPRSFELYEEYSQRSIADTIRMCRENFEKADLRAKRELETKVETEVKDFRMWLEETKNLEPTKAHYYSTSLKSLLLGLPIGVRIAQLFGAVLDTRVRE